MQMFQPKYTMNGLEVADRMNDNGHLHFRVLRVVLRSHLSHLQPLLQDIISSALKREFSSGSKTQCNWVELDRFTMAKKIITAANSVAFFGQDLSRNSEFLKAALDYPEHLLISAEILRFVPSCLAPLIAPILMRKHRASKVLVNYLTPLVDERLRRSKSNYYSPDEKPIDCIQFFVDANMHKEKWSARKIVQVILGIWFASVHQPALSLVYALDDLCDFPEYVEPLRRELERCYDTTSDVESLPLLDSFLKESARLHPSDSISVRRKVLRPYTFPDGTHLSTGDIACVPLQAIMRDSKHYPHSLRFDAFRSVDEQGRGSLSRFVDSQPSFPLWGLGKHAW